MCGVDCIADVLVGRRSEMPYIKRKGNIMLYGWKAKRHLALYVSIVLSCGGGYSLLASPHAYADQVTVDTGALPTSIYSGKYYGGTSTLGNASNHNTLILKGSAAPSGCYFIGGWAQGAGDATDNTVELTETAEAYSNGWYGTGVYGGFSQGGKATDNTVVLKGKIPNGVTNLYGGYSVAGKDATSGNTLKVQSKDNQAYSINNFEKMEFTLNNVSSGDTMLKVGHNYAPTAQTFDWGNISVAEPEKWQKTASGSKRVTLYDGIALTINNYVVTGQTDGDYEYGLSTNETTTTTTPGATTVVASKIYFDRNKYQNSKVEIDTGALPTSIYSSPYYKKYYGGTSTLGNIPNHNTLILKGSAAPSGCYFIGGWAQGAGDATDNTVELTETAEAYSNGWYGTGVYGGFSQGGKATDNTVVLKGKIPNGVTNLYGGYSVAGKDATSGNTLKVQSKDNQAYSINNFEKMEFTLNNVSSGDTMLKVGHNYAPTAQTFDWGNISVVGLSDWVTALSAAGVNDPMLTLYQGVGLILNDYAPRLIGNAGDYEFGTFANGTLASGTMTNATQIKLAGNKFQNVTSPVVDAATTSVHGGYSSYGNTTNTNVITVNSGAYTNVRAGYTDAVKGGSDKNELTFTGTASATNLYGGYTTGTSASAADLKADAAAKADAKGNTVNISGGTINANGKIAGGYIAKNTTLATPAASAGDAKGNKVNIESGTIGNNTSIYGGYTEGAGGATGNIVTISGGTFSGTSSIYGGYTEGTGKATGNIVNLGKADGTLSAAGLANVTLYGGGGTSASDRVKDNVLNVNAKATAKNIQNFGKVMFNFNSTIHTGDTMLTLNDTAGTSLDWKKFDISGGGPDGETTLMYNASGIALTSYDHSRAVSSNGTKEFVIYTDTGTGTGVKKILYGGYTFKGKTSASTNAEGDIWAGRSVIGNTTSGNTLTVNNNTATYRDAYGGWTAGTGTDATGDAANSSTGNTANLVAGTVRNIYGGFTSSDGGSATGNKVNISGGTVASASGIGGTVYGGYISSATSAGDATGNTVTITGGTVGDVYAGFTNGTGKTTGNTVNLGTKDDAVALGTVIGTIYGGNKTDATDNTLNVYDSATAKNIRNFDTVHFKGNSPHIAAGDTLLTLTNGATNLDWKKIYVNDLDSVTASATGDHIFTLLKNTNTINLSNYSTTGTRGNIKSDDYEADLVTDGNSAPTQNVYLKGYRFQNNKNAAYAGGTAPDGAWGGRSIIGKTVKNNTLTVTGGSATLNARGGMVENTERNADGSVKTSGNAETNKLILNAGAQTADAYGAEVKTKDGSATGNEVHLTAGTVGGSVYGAALTAAGATGSVTGSIVEVTGGFVTGDVYGGHTVGAGSVTKSAITLKGGSVTGNVYGGKTTGTGAATGHTLNLYGGSVTGSVYGGHSASGATTGNTVSLGDGEHSLAATINGTIYGGNGTDTTGNTLNVKTNAAAANIKNFENLAFYVNSSALNAANPMLTLSSGATNNLDWRKLTVDASKFSGTISTFEPYNLVLMQNAAGISFMKGTDDTYTLGGGVKSTTSGDFEFTIDTSSHAASTTQVTAAGYKFKNHTASYSETTPHTEAWAGRTAAGNKVEKNKLTVTAGNITAAAYGGLVINNKPNATTGDAENNMITVSGGNVQAAYGAKLLTKGGSATTNTAVITGGTVHDVYGASLAAVGATGTVTKGIVNLSNAANVAGNVYGGHIADSAATGTVTGSEVSLAGGSIGGTVYAGYNGGRGDAKGGKILLTGGAVTGNVYGGYAVGSGKTTGNVVTIGDGTNDATTVVTGTIAGGNKADATGNILAVQSKGAQAGTLSGFETIRFHLGQGVADGDNVLTLNQTTTLTYSTIEAPTGSTVSTWLGNVMEKNVHLLRMGAGKTLTLTGYHPATGSERSDDVEYSLVTDNNQSTTTAGGSLDLSAYKWRHADVKINSNAHANVFGGKTVYKTNGETKENKLTLQTGAAVTNAVAGDTQTASGTAEENALTIEDGTATNAIGAKTKAGRAYKNKAILLGGSVMNNLVGAESTHGAAEENTAAVTGGTVTNVMGAHTLAGDATGNHAVISGGTVTGSLKGAQSAGKAVKNTIEVKGGNLSGASVMGAEAVGDAEKNSVTITVTPTSNAATVITGAHSTGGSAVNNTVDVNAAVTGKIIGGATDSAGLDAIDNIVNVKADVTGDVYGGHAVRASLRNIVNIADGVTVTGNVYGGSCITAEGNIVNVGRGATVTGHVVAGNATGRNDNNIINLTGANVGGNVIGGVGGANDHDNTLAVCYETAHPTSHVNDFSGIKNLHFYLGEDIQNENPTLLKLGVTSKDIRGIDVGVGVKGRMARNLKVNDVISLMKVAGNGTLTTDADSVSPQVLVNHAEAMQGVSLLYGFDIMKRGTDELIATVTKAAISDQTKSFAETRAAATDFINRGANLLAGPGIASAKKAAGTEDKDARGYHLWAAMEHSDIETETGSFADTKGYHLSLGWARELKKKHATLTFTPFVEYGKGKYDSFLDDGTHGSGHVSYLGAGIMGRLEKTNGVWAEAALHGGKARSDYSGSIYSGTNSHYDSSNAYYAAHLGIGKEFRVNAKDRLDTYLRYFWSRQSGMQADIATSGRGAGVDTYDFGVVNSNRVRMGFRYTHKDSEKSEILAGLAWEYELSGKAGVSFQGYDAPSPSLRGGSLMLELAYRFAPKNSRFSYNVHMTGWQGTHRGVTGGAQVNWAF